MALIYKRAIAIACRSDAEPSAAAQLSTGKKLTFPVSHLHGLVQVGVSLVLSFMVVWDLPTISAGVSSLQTSRLAPIYNEVAPSVAVFGQLFGKALQAQARAGDYNVSCCSYSYISISLGRSHTMGDSAFASHPRCSLGI